MSTLVMNVADALDAIPVATAGLRSKRREERADADMRLEAAMDAIRSDGRATTAYDPGKLAAALKALRGERRFGQLYELATTVVHLPSPPVVARFGRAQAAIELKEFPIAMRELYTVLAAPGLSEADRGEAQALLGRVNKQQYVDTAGADPDGPSVRARASYVLAAIDDYAQKYRAAPRDRQAGWSENAYYHGGNLIALVWRAEHDRIECAGLLRRVGLSCFTAQDLAHELLEDLVPHAQKQLKRDAVKPDCWPVATAGEVLLAADPEEAARRGWGKPAKWLATYAARVNEPFMLHGTARQLEEVWLINPADPERADALAVLKSAIVKLGGDVALTAREINAYKAGSKTSGASGAATVSGVDEDGYERVVGGILPQEITWVYRLLDWGASIGRVKQRSKGQTIGTGFLFDGTVLGIRKYRKKLLFLTNAHVVSSIRAEQRKNALTPAATEIEFGALQNGPTDLRNGPRRVFSKPTVVWSSPRDELDATILELAGDGLDQLQALPLLDFDLYDTPETQDLGAIVVGYPDGGTLCFSPKNNDVREFGWRHAERQQHRFVHYRSSTDRGQSGSPVFNDQLVGVFAVHHFGAQQHHSSGGDEDARDTECIPRLNGRNSVWVANQGVLIKSIIQQARLDLGAPPPGRRKFFGIPIGPRRK